MSDNLQKRPSKGILKNSSSFDKHEAPQKKQKAKATQWDEMNIIATLHPADKDYGHMKIDEPKTPYNWENAEGGAAPDELDAEELAQMIAQSKDKPAKALVESSSSDEDESETPEERAKRKVFESKRRAHYNEGHAIKLARKLIEAAEEEDENPEDKEQGQSSSGSSPNKD